MSKLDKNKTSFLKTVKAGGGNRTQTHTNTKGRYPNKSYVEGLNKILPYRFNKSTDTITRDGKDCYLCPNQYMEGEFDVMHMNRLDNNNDEYAEEKNIVIENPTKRAGPIVQGMLKTRLEIVEVEKYSLFPHRCSLYFELIVEYPRLTYKHY